jgi:predicted AAA+ superfamily ATPase
MKVGRTEKARVMKSLDAYPVVALLGARQVGKTTLAKSIGRDFGKSSVYLDLENPDDFVKLNEPGLYFRDHRDKLIILDEIQLKPELFSILRSVVDEGESNGRFLILGSASPDLLNQSSQSLAGRIRYHELNPFSVFEVGIEHAERLWLRGGFPDAYLASDLEGAFDWIASFIKTFLERDLGMLGFRLSPHHMRRVWTMLAHYHGSTVNYSSLSRALGVSDPTVHHWIDVLEDTYMLRCVRPWSGNTAKRLVKSPKIYLRDSGIVHNLLGVEDKEKLLSHPVLGASWEGYVMEQIIAAAPDRSNVSFYRSSNGNEVDLILETPKRGLLAFEIKRSLSPSLNRGTYAALEDISPKQAYVVYSGEETYRMSEDITVIPLASVPDVFG